MRDTELKKERDRELFSLYKKGLSQMHFKNMHEASDWVRMQPANKFYISSKSLVNYIRAIERNERLPEMHKCNKEKMDLLYSQYIDFIRHNPDCSLPKDRICELLVEEKAPCFFICHESCLKALLRERKKCKTELFDRYVK